MQPVSPVIQRCHARACSVEQSQPLQGRCLEPLIEGSQIFGPRSSGRLHMISLISLFAVSRSSSRIRAHASKGPLQLCLDINKTIVMEDSSGGKSARALCNEALADSAWGSVHRNRWEFSGAPLSLEAPEPNLISYSAWVHELFKEKPADASDASSLEASRKLLEEAKKEKDRLRGSFAEVDGAAPDEVAQLLEPMLRHLLIPEKMRSSPETEAAGLADRETWFLLPSFLAAMRELLESDDKEQIPISVHFRTFGDDLPAVAREFNAFVHGEHPLHPGFQSTRAADICNRFGSYFRDSDGPLLALGVDLSSCENREEAVDRARSQGSRLVEGYQAIHDELLEISRSGETWCFRDHWRYWRDQAEAAEAGKLVVVSKELHTCFIDDNARGPDGHIVDVRTETGQQLAWREVLAAGHVVKAWPMAALSNEDYYRDLFRSAARRVQASNG